MNFKMNHFVQNCLFFVYLSVFMVQNLAEKMVAISIRQALDCKYYLSQVQFQKICWSRFFAMSQKLQFWPKMAIFFARQAKFGQNENFSQKSGRAIFYPYCPPTSCQVSEKSLERFPRSIRDRRTDVRTKVKLQNRSLRCFKK